MRAIATGLGNDIRHAWRLLVRQPGFSITAVVILALGIGVTATIFSITYSVLVKPLAWANSDRLIRVEERRGGQRGNIPWSVTNGTFRAWANRPNTIDALAGWMTSSRVLDGIQEPVRVNVVAVTPSLNKVIHAPVLFGRFFDEANAAPGTQLTAILSFRLWQQRFGGDRNLIGRTIRLNNTAYEVIGVMASQFVFPDRHSDIWVPMRPLSVTSDDGRQLRVMSIHTIALLKPDSSADQAAAEATARARNEPDIGRAASLIFGSNGEITITTATAAEILTKDVRAVLVILLCAAGLLLIVAIANVVNIQLARAATRLQETTVRAAMGGNSWRLARLWLVESAFLGICAGTVGALLSWAIHQVLPAMLPANFPRVDEIRFDATIALFSLALTIIVAVACGIIPALLIRPTSLAGSFSQDRAALLGGHRTPGHRIRTAIMASEVAIACTLLVVGGLMGRSLVAMTTADRGYDPDNVLTARLTFAPAIPANRRTEVLESLQDRLRAVPGVKYAEFGDAIPLMPSTFVVRREIASPRNPAETVHIEALRRVVSPDYLSALGLHLSAGRLLKDTDTSTSPAVLVVNREFAIRYLGSQPIGTRVQFKLFSHSEWEIVGVVNDVLSDDVHSPPRPEFFVSYRQIPAAMSFDPIVVIRTDLDSSAYAGMIRTFVHEIDRSVVVDSVLPMRGRISASLERPRMFALIFSAFAILTLLIAGVGLFGVLSHVAAQRRSEIGLRVALGASPADIVRFLTGQMAVILIGGLAVGLGVSAFAVSSLSTMLYGVAARDPVSFAMAPLLIVLIAAVACTIPTIRAARLDPLRALRS